MNIGDTTQFIHRLVALQWIENDDPETKTCINHINRNKLDNSIANLEWCTHSNNVTGLKRKVRIGEFLDELPADAIQIEEYEGLELDNYYYDIEGERLLKIQTLRTMNKIKIIKPSISYTLVTVKLYDVYGKGHTRSYHKFIRFINQLVE